MINVIKKQGVLLILGLVFSCVLFTMPVKAAEVKKACNYLDKNKTISYDLTGDSKKEKIKFTFVKDEYDDYVDKVKVYVNGKKALTIDPEYGFYEINVRYINMSKSKRFLQIYATCENGIVCSNKIYKYNKKGKKLTSVLDLMQYPLEAQDVTSATSSQVKVRFAGQPMETGWINAKFTFVYKDGKFKLKSNTASVKSSVSVKVGDKYDKYFKKNKFVVSKKLKFYTSSSLKKTAFTAKKKDVLTLTKVKMSGKKVYLQFKKGDKTGWRKIFTSDVYDDWMDMENTGWFYGVWCRGTA